MAGRRAVWVPATLAVAFAALTALVATGGLLAADSWLQPGFTAVADGGAGAHVAGALAALGEQRIAGAVLAATLAWCCVRRRTLRPAAAAMVAVAGTALTVVLLKVAIGRTAPGAGASEVLAAGRSYPSGHAATAAVCLLLIAGLLAVGIGWPPWQSLVVAAAVMALGVAWATVALGFHWASDVAGGLLVGAAWASGVRPWLVPGRVGAAQRPGR